MKIDIKHLMFLLVLAFAFSSCQEYLDVNDDPNRVQDVPFENLLPTVIERASAAHYSVARSSGVVTQQIGFNTGTYPKIIGSSAAWESTYLHVFPNCVELIDKATALDAWHYVGIAQILMAENLGLLTDSWESVPYSEALKSTNNLTPAYDSQTALYRDINSLLDDAIANLNKTSAYKVSEEGDLIYKGNIEKWLRVAHTLKARYALHLSNKGLNNQEILDDLIANGLESNSDDWQLGYNDVNNNSWYIVAKNNNTGNYTVAIGGYLVYLLKANDDPRLYSIVDTNGLGGDEPVGASPADLSYGSDAHNTHFKETSTWLSSINSPYQMLTFAEAKFIEAEIALPIDKAIAYQAYLDGIAANMEKMGVNSAAYLESPTVAVGMNNLTLSQIMVEKYKATYLMPETWVDMRRYNYDSNIYTDFAVPDPDSVINGAIYRMEYPSSELSRNSTQVNKVLKENTEKMWRDQ